MRTREQILEYSRKYSKEYYWKHKGDSRLNYRPKYQEKIDNNILDTRRFKQGQLVQLSGGRTGVVIRDYDKFIRVNVTAGDKHYSECFYREDIV